MQSKENLTKILDESIMTMEIADPTVVWFSERLEWLVDRLLAQGVIMPGYAEWMPCNDYKIDKHGNRYTHYCSKCGQYGFDEFPRCPRCASEMGRTIQPPVLERVMEL